MTWAIVLNALPALGCDICGCGTSQAYIGLQPGFQKNHIGLRYRQSRLTNHLGQQGARTYLSTEEQYHLAELSASVSLHKKWRATAVIPLAFMQQKRVHETRQVQGLADAWLGIQYRWISRQWQDKQNRLWRLDGWMGLSGKLPTGRYRPNMGTGAIDNFQLGTGSVDGQWMALIDLRRNDAGIAISPMVRVNGANGLAYRYGSRASVLVQAYYKWRLGAASISPNAGFQYDVNGEDTDRDFALMNTRASLPQWVAGLEFNTNKHWVAGLRATAPLNRGLVGLGTARIGPSVAVHVGYVW